MKALCLLLFFFGCRDAEQASAKPTPTPPKQMAPSPPAPEEPESPAVATTEPLPSETAAAPGVQLRLEGCSLTFTPSSGAASVTTAMELPAPCQFAKDKSGATQQVKTDRGPTFLIVSSRPAGNDCDTRVRAVVAGKKGLLVSTKEKAFASCGMVAMDTMLFHVLAASSAPVSAE